jgi:hypothetical protein
MVDHQTNTSPQKQQAGAAASSSSQQRPAPLQTPHARTATSIDTVL